MSTKRKPRTPSPQESQEDADEESEDVYAGRRLSVTEFDLHDGYQDNNSINNNNNSSADYGYEAVGSPGASSTSSEPAYIRQPGFQHHAHEFRSTPSDPTTSRGLVGGSTSLSTSLGAGGHMRSPVNSNQIGLQSPTGSITSKGSKKKKSSINDPPGGVSGGDTPPSNPSTRPRVKKDPLPMKMRAFPQSFWLQPNKTTNLPPSSSTLPPLILGKDSCDLIDVRPVTPTTEETSPARVGSGGNEGRDGEKEGGGLGGGTGGVERTIKVGNPDLLSRLFDSVEQGEKKKIAVVRRGRPRKPPSTVLPRVLRDDDPCLVSTVTESILPLIPDKTPASSGASTPLGIRQGPQVLEMVNIRDGDRTISLPSLQVEHNYNQLLTELVLKL